jgi:PAS domain S-box-containing protein
MVERPKRRYVSLNRIRTSVSQSARLPSLRSRLVLLTLAILSPALGAAALTQYAGYRHARQEVEKHLQETSRALSLVVDRQLGQAEALLWSLSASPMLRTGDSAGFDSLAREAIRIPGAWIVVEEPGRQLVNTRLPAGTIPPNTGTTDHWKGLTPGQIRISNLFTGLVTKQPSVAIETLIETGAGQRYVTIIMQADTVARILADQALPSGWNGAIVDRNGTVVARSPDHDRFVGRPATGDNLDRIRGGVTQGVFESVNLAGVETVLALSRSPSSGWTTILAVPRTELSAGIKQLALYLAGMAGLLSALGAGLALHVARRIARPVEALVADAEALARGQWAPASSVGPVPDTQETAALRRAFQDARAAVGQREAERDQAATALKKANATLEARVTERTRDLALANASLQESQAVLADREALYSSVFRFNTDGLFVVRVTERAELLVETYNPAIEILMGRPADEARGLPLAEVVPPALLPLIEGRIRECLAAGEPISYERAFAFAARRGVWAVTLVPIRDAAGRIVRILGSNRDITETRDAEAEIKAARDRYSALFEHSPLDLALIDVTADGVFVYEDANPALMRSLGFQRGAFVGRQPAELFSSQASFLLERYRECVTTRSLVEYEAVISAPVGEVVRRTVLAPLLDGDGRVAKIFATSMDLTQQRRMEERLRQSERLETVGQLTGGIAHDFNNLLTVVMGNLDMLRRAKPERASRLIDNALAAVEQGRKLTGQLLAFSRRQPLKPEVVDLAALIGRMDGLLSQSLRGDIVLEIDVAEGLWPVQVDPTQLQSALINLAVNARDAMPSGGTFRIRAQNRVSQEGDGVEGVAIQVSDTGVGIRPEDLPRVFEPFFTTKETGKGTGLGLAQVYGFVQQSGGTVDIMSEPGRGTTLSLMLPRASRAAARASEAPPTPDVAGGRALRILLVEDNGQVAELATELLREAGHVVELAGTGRDALDRLARDPSFDLLFSDLVMPGGVNGLQLARTVRQKWPSMPVLLATGYSSESSKAQAEGHRLLAKPYEPAALVAAVAEVTGARQTTAKVIPLRPA